MSYYIYIYIYVQKLAVKTLPLSNLFQAIPLSILLLSPVVFIFITRFCHTKIWPLTIYYLVSVIFVKNNGPFVFKNEYPKYISKVWPCLFQHFSSICNFPHSISLTSLYLNWFFLRWRALALNFLQCATSTNKF